LAMQATCSMVGKCRAIATACCLTASGRLSSRAKFDEKPACPKKRPGPFMRHGHDTPREDMPKSSFPASCLTDRESRGIPGVRIARTTIYLIAAPVPIKAELHVSRVGGESDHAGIWLSRPVAWPLAPPPGIKPRAPAFLRCKLMRKRTPPAQPYARIARKLMPCALAGKPVAAWRHAQAYAQQDTFCPLAHKLAFGAQKVALS